MSKKATKRLVPWLTLLLPLASCNHYEMFLVSGHEQVSFSNKVDVLFVTDNSSSTAPYSAAILQNFEVFLEDLAEAGAGGIKDPTLTDAVGDYLTYTSQRGRITDFRMAVTTTDNTFSGGFTGEADPGEAGLIVGDNPIVNRDDEDIAHRFKQNLGCWASCWNGFEMPTDNTYTGVEGDCPFPESGEATTQYVDCLCNDVNYPDGENWDSEEICGSGNEMPVEATLMAMCRAVDDPPDICNHVDSPFRDSWKGTNSEWLRDDSTVIVVFITDEGDSSEITVGGLYGNSEVEADVYLQAFAEFGRTIKFAAIGPTLDCNNDGLCTTVCSNSFNNPSRTGSMRLKNLAEATGGFYNGITEAGEAGDGETCPTADFAENLADLGSMLVNLQSAFELQSVPDETTIRVYVDDEEVARAAILEENEAGDVYSDGWTYEPSKNAVVFWGETIPDFNQEVRIFFKPVDGNPRELPF
jgi:hypothetical protein